MKTVNVLVPIQNEREEWVRPSEPNPSLPDDLADRYEGLGYVEIVSHDGKPVTWAACCNGDHDHA